jgi:hypothetical protein
MAVVGGTQFPVKRDTTAQTCAANWPRLAPDLPFTEAEMATAHHGDACAGSILLLRTRREVQVHVYRGIWYPQWVLCALTCNAKVVRVRLDPTERELGALLDDLHGRHSEFSRIFRGEERVRGRTHIAK